jgi:hypothetical protein
VGVDGPERDERAGSGAAVAASHGAPSRVAPALGGVLDEGRDPVLQPGAAPGDRRGVPAHGAARGQRQRHGDPERGRRRRARLLHRLRPSRFIASQASRDGQRVARGPRAPAGPAGVRPHELRPARLGAAVVRGPPDHARGLRDRGVVPVVVPARRRRA